jgi:heme/copper-type cytochrome/quinol oxidase subunit 4
MTWRPEWILMILVLASGLSWLLAEGAIAARLSTSAVILIAAIKINLVVTYFMELDWRPRPWRLLLTGWIGLVTLAILGGYWIS